MLWQLQRAMGRMPALWNAIHPPLWRNGPAAFFLMYIHCYDEVLANINSVLTPGHLTNCKFNNTVDTYRDYSIYDDIDAAPIRPYVR